MLTLADGHARRIDTAVAICEDESSGVLLTRLDASRERHVAIAPGSVAVCVCLRGRLDLQTVFGAVALLAGEAFVAVSDQLLRVAVRGHASGLLLASPNDALRQRRYRNGHAGADPPLFTQVHTDAGALLAIARVLEAMPPGPEAGALVDAALEHVFEMDRRFDVLVERCPGRTAAHRRQTLARFERTRNRVRFAASHDLDVGDLARQTNYTRWHFMRVFRQIYGVSPVSYLIQLRRQTCERLLAAHDMAIADVAAQAGFASAAAFARWFRAAYGVTASEWRLRRAGLRRAS